MDVDLRPVRKLRESAAARSALGPIMEAVCASPADLARLRVVCDWIQYKQNFRKPVVSRPIADADNTGTDTEIAFDLRRCTDIDLTAHVKKALSEEQPGLPLEPWVPGRDSCIWRFNQLYWQALSHWEVATGREYEQSLPGGESDARNTEAARELILELFRIWDELDARRALPEELYVLELGVGNGSQARTWLDEFVQLDRRHGREYYHRLRYLMGDYSPHVLERAHLTVAHHAELGRMHADVAGSQAHTGQDVERGAEVEGEVQHRRRQAPLGVRSPGHDAPRRQMLQQTRITRGTGEPVAAESHGGQIEPRFRGVHHSWQTGEGQVTAQNSMRTTAAEGCDELTDVGHPSTLAHVLC